MKSNLLVLVLSLLHFTHSDNSFFDSFLPNNDLTPTSSDNCCVITPDCSADSAQTCDGQPGCRKVAVIPTTLGIAVLLSPFYEQVTSNVSFIQDVDNICYTFFPISSSVFLLFRSIVYSDGSNVVEVFIESDIPGCPGILRGQGLTNSKCGSATCVYNDYVVGSGLLACPDVFVLYRCYFLGSCDDRDSEEDYRTGLSSTMTVSFLCKATIKLMANSQQFKGTVFYELPNKLNKMCVTEFNGAYSINAFKVPAKNSICYPAAIQV